MVLRVPPAPRCASPLALFFPGDRSLITGVMPPPSPKLSLSYCSSGKEALLILLRQIRKLRNKRFVAVQAYTCPDIATAVMAAGFKLALCDVDYNTLRPRPETLTVAASDIAAVVLSNLYGLPDDLAAWQPFAEEGVIVIDDACQAALSEVNGVAVGQRTGWGVYSFGRGKAISGVGGGAALMPADNVSLNGSELGNSSWFSDARALIYWLGFRAFSHPFFYSIAERMPFLNLGATELHRFVSSRPISRIELAAARAKLAEVSKEVEAMRRNAAEYARCLPTTLLIQPYRNRDLLRSAVTPLRYPVLAKSGTDRNELLAKLLGQTLSCPPGYPKVLADYPELAGNIECGELLNSREVAATLFTLPTHLGVERSMIEALGLL